MSTRIFTTNAVDRFTRKKRIGDEFLIDAVDRADRGLIYAVLSQGLIKQAVARPNASAQSSYRAIIGYKEHSRAFFLHVFAKNDTGNISDNALTEFRIIAEKLAGLTDLDLQDLIEDKALREIHRGNI